MAVENKPPQPEVIDQNTGGNTDRYQSAETQATERMREDTRTGSGTGNGGTEASALNANDDTSDSMQGGETAAGQMLREVEDAYKAASRVASSLSKMFSSGLSPETAAKFGTPAMFDSSDNANGGEAAAGRIEATAAAARQEEAETKHAPRESGKGSERPEGSSSLVGDALDWASNRFNDYVVKPASEMLNNVTDLFGSASDWMFEGTRATGAIANINNVGNREFRQETRQAMRNFNFDLAGAQDQSGQGLEMPDNAVLAGSAQVGGSEVQVFRTPEGDTFLKSGDKVIARQRPDGSYGLSLRDGSNLDFKLEKGEDGKYKLESLERTSDGQLQQKYSDGVFYNYNYDSQGNRTSVDAAADLDGPLSQERLDKIRAELGDNGSAALRIRGANGKAERMLLQAHGKDTHSLTNIDTKRAQIFHNGQEYRLNERDRLERVGQDGQWHDTEEQTVADESEQRQRQRVRDLAQRVGRRAQGNSEEAVDGVEIHRDEETGDAEVRRRDPETGRVRTTTQMPADSGRPIAVTNQEGERAEIQGNNFRLDARDGKPLVEFNENSGLRTDKFNADDTGLTDLENGNKIDKDGNVLDLNGNFIGGSVEEFWSDNLSVDCPHEEYRENVVAAADEVKSLGVQSLGFTLTNVTAAIQIAREALGKAGPFANDPMVQLAMCTPIAALNRAVRNDIIRDNAPKLAEAHVGAFDALTVDQYMRSYQLSNSPLSPRDFIRSQARSRFPESNAA